MSRFQHERDLRPRLTSILGRQLERYRELVPSWNAQKQAVRCVVARKEQVAEQKRREVEALAEEREDTDRLYQERYDTLCKGLAQECEQAKASSEDQREALERSLAEEAKVMQTLREQDARHEQLKSSLDQTQKQLDEVNANMHKCQEIIDEWNREQPPPDPASSPELLHAAHRIQDTLKARDQIRSQAQTMRAEALLAQEELRRQRAYSTRMEDFVRRVSSGGGRYVLNGTTKREAARLLYAAARLRSAVGLEALEADEDLEEEATMPAGQVATA